MREAGYYWVWFAKNIDPIIGYWDGTSWNIIGMSNRYKNTFFYKIDEKQIKRE